MQTILMNILLGFNTKVSTFIITKPLISTNSPKLEIPIIKLF